ncbi:MAG: nuclease-related domain-containing protein [Chloroflexota bacterium]
MTVLKEADSKQPNLDALAALLERSALDGRTRKRLEDEVWAVRAGIQGEREAAYAINFEYADREGYIVIHDLRIERPGRAAQIDHLIINRALDVWVCETKAFSEGVKIDERGHWYRYGGRFAHGMESPVKQNERHLAVLRELFESGEVRLPRRVVTIKPNLIPAVLISNNARIDIPKSKRAASAIDGLDTVIKIEQLVETIHRSIDERNPVRLIAKVVSPATILAIGEQLVALHRPMLPDYATRFGLPPTPSSMPAGVETEVPASRDQSCASCSKPVTPKVAAYSRAHAERFGGRILCFDCQRSTPRPRPAS